MGGVAVPLLGRAAWGLHRGSPRPPGAARRSVPGAGARWSEEKREDGVRWKQLEHKGPYFAPSYEPLPDDVRFCYDGEPMKLSVAAEVVATFYGKMLDHEYTTKEVFRKNFFSDWRKGLKNPRAPSGSQLEGGALRQHGDLAGILDRKHPELHQVRHAEPELKAEAEDNVAAKILSYNWANRAVAVLCNHQCATPKTFARSMQNLQLKIEAKRERVAKAKAELEKAEAELGAGGDGRGRSFLEKRRRLLGRLEEQLGRLSTQATGEAENKQVALGTSKLSYLDPCISVAWCWRFAVPIEKIYNKTQREKFAWAIDMAGEDFEF